MSASWGAAHRGSTHKGGGAPASPRHREPSVVKDDTAQHLWDDLTQAMGLDPFAVLDCFCDLGMSDAEIARYFHIRPADVVWLRSRPRAVTVAAAPSNDPE